MKKNAKAIFDGVNEHLFSVIVKEQGPPTPDEKPVAYAQRLIEAMNKYADDERIVTDTIIKRKVVEIQLKIDRPGFIIDKLEQAKTDRLDFEALKVFLSKCLRRGKSLLKYPELSAFSAGVMNGTIKPPPKAKRGGGYLNERRNFILAVAVWMVCEHFSAIKPSRNEATAPGGCSADIVAVASNESYDIAIDAYNKNKRFLDFIKFTKIESHYERTGIVQKTWPFPYPTNF